MERSTRKIALVGIVLLVVGLIAWIVQLTGGLLAGSNMTNVFPVSYTHLRMLDPGMKRASGFFSIGSSAKMCIRDRPETLVSAVHPLLLACFAHHHHRAWLRRIDRGVRAHKDALEILHHHGDGCDRS